MTDLTSTAASIAAVLNIPAPQKAAPADRELVAALQQAASGKPVSRLLIYNPDAIASWLVAKKSSLFNSVREQAPIIHNLHSVYPPKTPVCFASMYTGTPPAVHGIRKYIKYQLETDSLFDALIRSGKRPCIVTVSGQSMDILFRGRNMDYYAMPNDAAVIAKACDLILENRHDCIFVYNQAYDDAMHRTHPLSGRSMRALNQYIAAFTQLIETARKAWRDETTLTGFLTDHGTHRTWYGLGTHGADIPQDMNIEHFYGIL